MLFCRYLAYSGTISGGQETTATTLSWLVKYLPTDPEIQRQLHKEVVTVFGSGSGDPFQVALEQFDNVEQLPVLEAVVVETQRCACVAAGIGRVRRLPILLVS